MKDHIQRKLRRINELNAQIEAAQKELEQILSPEKTSYQQPSFNLYAEITSLLRSSPEGLSSLAIKNAIAAAHPDNPIDPQKIMSAIHYMKRQKKVEGAGYGKYKLSGDTSLVEQNIA